MLTGTTFTVSLHAMLRSAMQLSDWVLHVGGSLCSVVYGCSEKGFTIKTSCKLLCVVRFMRIHMADSIIRRRWLAPMEYPRKLGVRGTHQHLLSYRKGCLILTMYLIFHLCRLFWNITYFFLESPLIHRLALLLEPEETFYCCMSVGKVPCSDQHPSWMGVQTAADNIMSSSVL